MVARIWASQNDQIASVRSVCIFLNVVKCTASLGFSQFSVEKIVAAGSNLKLPLFVHGRMFQEVLELEFSADDGKIEFYVYSLFSVNMFLYSR